MTVLVFIRVGGSDCLGVDSFRVVLCQTVSVRQLDLRVRLLDPRVRLLDFLILDFIEFPYFYWISVFFSEFPWILMNFRVLRYPEGVHGSPPWYAPSRTPTTRVLPPCTTTTVPYVCSATSRVDVSAAFTRLLLVTRKWQKTRSFRTPNKPQKIVKNTEFPCFN